MPVYPLPSGIQHDLVEVERALAEVVSSCEGELRQACAATLEAGGKRLRPALVLVCGLAGEYDLEALMPPSIAVELVHMASLVHDDILDDAKTRRGRPSVHAKWGPRMGTATGDFLFSKSFEVLAPSAVKEATTILAGTSLELTLGELLQRRDARRIDVGREQYLARIRAKTASLFSASCRLGALATRAPAADVERLTTYGEQLGMAFQIYDDVLDVSGETEVLGKKVGADFRDGTITLPMMLAAEELGRRDWLVHAIGDGRPDEETIADALETIKATDAAGRAKEIARSYVDSAVLATDRLSSEGLQTILADIGNYVIERYH